MRPGSLISHYEIIEKLGGGGMGVVYRARDTKLGRPVALKFLPPGLNLDAEANKRFMVEARAASSLDHPNICTIYEVGETDDGRLFIAMALYEGQTLKGLLSEGPLEPGRAVRIAAQIADGLSAAHEEGITHRDIKPANVMVTDKDRVKILDFGLAKLAGTLALTRTGSTLGTAAYMSPEQLGGGPIDFRTDLWALGVVLYEMLAGHRPFGGEYEQALAYAILNDNPETPKGVSTELASAATRLLEKKPSDRYADAEAVRAALENVPEVREGPAVAPQPTRLISHRAAAAAALILAIAVFGWLFWGSSIRDSGDGIRIDYSAIAVMPFSIRGSPDLEYLEEGLVDLLSTKLDGAGDLRCIDPNALLGTLAIENLEVQRPAEAMEISHRLGGGRFIMGSVVQVADEIQMTASLYRSADEPEVEALVIVEGENVLMEAVDELALKVVEGVLDPSDELRSIGAMTTRSIPALKAYLAGESHVRTGHFDHAVSELEKAVGLDSTFALAWARLAYAAGWAFQPQLEAHALEQAVRFSGDLPERIAWILRAILLGFIEGDVEQSTEIFRSILSRYPENLDALQQFGELLFHTNKFVGRSQGESAQYFERALALAPDRGDNLLHLFDIAIQIGDLERADSLSRVYRSISQDGRQSEIVGQSVAIAARARGDSSWTFEDAGDLDALGTLLLLDNASSSLKDLEAARMIGRYAATPGRYPEPIRQTAQYALGNAEATSGRLARSRKEQRLAGDLYAAASIVYQSLLYTLPIYPADDSLLYALRDTIENWNTHEWPVQFIMTADVLDGQSYLARAYVGALLAIRMEDPIRYQQYRAELAAEAREGDGTDIGYSFIRTLDAVVAWQAGDTDLALKALDDAQLLLPWRRYYRSPLLAQPLNRYVRAAVLFDAGRPEDALPYLNSLIESDASWYLGPSYIMLADIYEQLGDVERAIEYNSRLLHLWRDCDPELIPIRDRVQADFDRLLHRSVREPDI